MYICVFFSLSLIKFLKDYFICTVVHMILSFVDFFPLYYVLLFKYMLVCYMFHYSLRRHMYMKIIDNDKRPRLLLYNYLSTIYNS